MTMTMLETRTLTIHIRRPFDAVNDFVAEPQNFAKWAAGLGHGLKQVEGKWVAHTPQGPIVISFTPKNMFGVLDHQVYLNDGTKVYVPMRAVKNEEGTDIIFTLFRQPGMDDSHYAHDITLVQKDLRTLKQLLEQE